MDKKGFTLIEILSVIVIIAIITIIAIPSINYLSNRSNNKAINAQENEYVSITKSFVNINESMFEKKLSDNSVSCYYLSLDEMQNIDLIPGITNLPSKAYYKENGIEISYVDNKLKYAYMDENINNCESAIDVVSEVTYDDIDIGDSVEDNDVYSYLYDGYTKDTNVTIDLPSSSYIFPVVYDEKCDRGNGCFRKADTDRAWYDYSKGRWANLVKVKPAGSYCEMSSGKYEYCYDDIKNRTYKYYKSSPANTAISLDDIEKFYVYIPRFDYKIEGDYGIDGTKENPGTITIEFNNNLDDVKIGDAKTEFLTHPAFVYENVISEDNITTTPIHGFWVEKFEHGIPYKTVGLKEHTSRFSFTGYVDYYGYNNYGYHNLLDSMDNMISNYEWGAVTYLSQSKYGIKGEHSECEKINPTSKFSQVSVSGIYNLSCGSGCYNGTLSAYDGRCINEFHEVTDGWGDYMGMGESVVYGTYKSYPIYKHNKRNCKKGLCGSTTGTIYGIYDMVGGLPEYVFATMGLEYEGKTYSVSPDVNYTRNNDITVSVFCDCGVYNKIYILNVYGSNDGTAYKSLRFSYSEYNRYGYNGFSEIVYGGEYVNNSNGKLGDATYETDTWFNNNNSFMRCTKPYGEDRYGNGVINHVHKDFMANPESAVVLVRGTSNIFDYLASDGQNTRATSRNTFNSVIW